MLTDAERAEIEAAAREFGTKTTGDLQLGRVASGLVGGSYLKGATEYAERAKRERAALVEALTWYLEDDKRSVEMGILEAVEARPAAAALAPYRDGQEVERA